MRLTFIFLAMILGVTIHQEAAAACRWEWDCSQGYPCQQVQVCDDAVDLPTIRPPQISPHTATVYQAHPQADDTAIGYHPLLARLPLRLSGELPLGNRLPVSTSRVKGHERSC